MASKSRGQDSPLECLFKSPFHFNFFQAVRLLEQIQTISLNNTVDSQHEFYSHNGYSLIFSCDSALHYPRGAITGVKFSNATHQKNLIEISTPFMGLFGINAVMPRYITRLVNTSIHNKEAAVKNYFDLYHQRLIELFYLSWKKYRLIVSFEDSLTIKTSDQKRQTLLALNGNLGKYLENRLAISDNYLLYYTGIFSNSRSSIGGLRALLHDFTGYYFIIEPFIAHRLLLKPEDQTRLGKDPIMHNQLGRTAIVGSRVYDIKHKFRIKFGPLTYHQYMSLLPNGSLYNCLTQLIRRYVGVGLIFELQVVLKKEEVRACQIGSKQNFYLGWNSWLGVLVRKRDADDLILNC